MLELSKNSLRILGILVVSASPRLLWLEVDPNAGSSHVAWTTATKTEDPNPDPGLDSDPDSDPNALCFLHNRRASSKYI